MHSFFWVNLLAQAEPDEGVAIAMGIFMLVCILFSVVLGIASFAFWLWMLIDCITYETKQQDNQFVLWLLLILLLGVIGAAVYYFVRRGQQQRQQPQSYQPSKNW